MFGKDYSLMPALGTWRIEAVPDSQREVQIVSNRPAISFILVSPVFIKWHSRVAIDPNSKVQVQTKKQILIINPE